MSWINKYMNIKGIRILSAILIAAISFFLLATKVPETKPVKSTLQNVEESKETVFKFAGAVVASSLAISALPDDFASPLANSFTDMNKYFVIILAALRDFLWSLALTLYLRGLFPSHVPYTSLQSLKISAVGECFHIRLLYSQCCCFLWYL